MKKDMQLKITYLAIFSILLSLVAYFMFFQAGSATSDVYNFYHQAEWTKAGLKPYVDFILEFPPASLLFFLIPSVFTSDYDTYRALFSIMIVIFSVASIYLVIKLSDLLNKNWILPAIVFSILIFIFTDNNSFFIKFDIIPVFFSLLSTYYYMIGKKNIAYFIMMVAVLIKLYPILFLAIMLIYDAIHIKNTNSKCLTRYLTEKISICLFASLLIFIPYILNGITLSDILSFVGIQADRGFHTESIMGTISLLLGNLGLIDYSIVPANDTYNVESIISDALIQYWPIILILAIITTLSLIALKNMRHGRVNNITMIQDMLVILLIFILFNNIFSTQYLIWTFPLLALTLISENRKTNVVYVMLLIVVAIVSVQSLDLPFDITFASAEFMRDCILFFILYILMSKNGPILKNRKRTHGEYSYCDDNPS